MKPIEIFIQSASLLVLAVTVLVSFRQLAAATAQAKSSEAQAKASERMARLSMEQTELMRKEVHASFQPIVVITGGEWRPHSAKLTLQNIGPGAAMEIRGMYHSGRVQPLGNLSSEQSRTFEFDCDAAFAVTHPFRLEYRSIVGVNYWAEAKINVTPTGPSGIEGMTHGTK